MNVDSAAVATGFSVCVAGVVSPGPNFVAVAHRAASGTRADALALAGGVVTVNLFWASGAILGIGFVFALFPGLATAGVTGASWYGLVALVLPHAAIASAYRRATRWADRVCGVLIAGPGVRQLIR